MRPDHVGCVADVPFRVCSLGGMCGAIVTSPFDVVKTRVQSVEYNGPPPGTIAIGSPIMTGTGNPYRTTWSTLINSYHAEGTTFFFRGLTPTLLR